MTIHVGDLITLTMFGAPMLFIVTAEAHAVLSELCADPIFCPRLVRAAA